ncbi:N-acetylmannosamine-6-phosphate 2-epimerase [Edaphobacter flagellatus]|uniref:N-acetylmannosamine-6-phosphate 2-epimerase n=1 Tax=Edaphobacter flagellatus TaxID=1933044 RepID=UPI0021B1C904|nr:N-acetylmannosamine-6-phosphate 2-epimerase [Edaphobacter flagellatus]
MAFDPTKQTAASLLGRLKGKLIVSCQADRGDPMDHAETIIRLAAAVLRGGAEGLRAEGAERIRAFRALSPAPILGMAKTWDAQGEVYITPTFALARDVNDAGADMIALDCTRRRLSEAEPWPEMVKRIQIELQRPVLGDIASLEDGIMAEEAGVDAIATTLYGYTAETAGKRSFNWDLLEALVARLRIPVFAEGHIEQPEEVQRALKLGAHAVVVGSAITRPEKITARFVAATRL